MIRRVKLKGFKSIKSMDVELRDLNVLIGANGAGKSNLLSFFKMLNEMIGERLQLYRQLVALAFWHFWSSVAHGAAAAAGDPPEAELEFDGETGFDGSLPEYAANDDSLSLAMRSYT